MGTSFVEVTMVFETSMYMRKTGHQDESYTGTFQAYSFDTNKKTLCVQFNSKNDEHLKAAFPNLFKHPGQMKVCPDRGYDHQIANAKKHEMGLMVHQVIGLNLSPSS